MQNELAASILSIIVPGAQSSGVVNKRSESDWGSHRVRTDRLLPNFLINSSLLLLGSIIMICEAILLLTAAVFGKCAGSFPCQHSRNTDNVTCIAVRMFHEVSDKRRK